MKMSSTFHPHLPKSCQMQKGSLLVAHVQEWSPGCQSPAASPQAVEKDGHQKTESKTDLTVTVSSKVRAQGAGTEIRVLDLVFRHEC